MTPATLKFRLCTEIVQEIEKINGIRISPQIQAISFYQKIEFIKRW